jgi:UDP-N-acetylmuramoyl-tripeptide--D-alanyl-D-alanine ligase
MAGRAAGQVRTFGSAEGSDVRFGDLVLDDLGRPAFLLHADGETARVTMSLVGEHHAGNATAAAAVALTLGLRLDAVAVALGAATAVVVSLIIPPLGQPALMSIPAWMFLVSRIGPNE